MKTNLPFHIPFFLLGLVFCAYFFWGVPEVPFHPDESTYLFMGSDFKEWITNPFSLIWDQEKAGSIRQHYREIDAPLTRYLLGFGYTLAGKDPLPADWDWRETWDFNRSTGALPTQEQLVLGRAIMAAFFPLSLIFLYLTGLELQGRTTGLVAVVFFSTNSLVLLHTRRAMAEGPLVFATIFFLWALTKINLPAWTLGLGAAIAFNSKHSLAAVVPAGLAAGVWLPEGASPRRRLLVGMQYLLAFGLFTMALNPILWREPRRVAQRSLAARSRLMDAQVNDFSAQNPGLVLDSFGDRLLAATAQLYLLPPSFQEAGNYLAQTQESIDRYLAVPGHALFRTLTIGGVILTLTLFGVFVGSRQIRQRGWRARKGLVLLLTATGLQTLAILFVIPLPFQRYYMPLVPYSVIWISFGLAHILVAVKGQLVGNIRHGHSPTN